VGKLKKGYTANGVNYKVHLDGYDQLEFLRTVSGTVGNERAAKSARDKFFYTGDDGLLVGLRQGDYKYVYAEPRSPVQMQVWSEPFTRLRLQKTFNLFQAPYERADITSNTFWDWQIDHVGSVYGSIDEVVKFAATFNEFPPRSIPPSFSASTIETLDDIRDAKKRATETQKREERSQTNIDRRIASA
jgi:arylsulfatase